MPNTSINIHQEYQRLLKSQNFERFTLDYSILKSHIEKLKIINQVQESAISIFDLSQLKHVYVSKDYESLLGWNLNQAEEQGINYINSKIHPDDFDTLNKAGINYLKLAFELKEKAIRKLWDFKYVTDYRILNKKGDYIRVIEQHKVLELDKNNNIWLALSILDLSPDNDIESKARSRLIDIKKGEIFKIPEFINNAQEEQLLSLREIEILQLISKGLISKQIADQLFLSANTVNTHRQRIIKKLKVSNTFEALKYAAELGLIH